MSDFKKNITNINKKDRDKYFQLPKDYQEYLDEKSKSDKSMEGSKKRLEEQLEIRKKYISLLEDAYQKMKQFIEDNDGIDGPAEDLYEKNMTLAVIYEEMVVKVAKFKVEAHNLEIEITAQKNIFVDTYIYYKEDFMKRYTDEGGEKKSIFN